MIIDASAPLRNPSTFAFDPALGPNEIPEIGHANQRIGALIRGGHTSKRINHMSFPVALQLILVAREEQSLFP